LLWKDPLLNSLAYNGGLTLTLAPKQYSPAVLGGAFWLALDFWGHPLTTDQRGQPRYRAPCYIDIGAYQWNGTPGWFPIDFSTGDKYGVISWHGTGKEALIPLIDTDIQVPYYNQAGGNSTIRANVAMAKQVPPVFQKAPPGGPDNEKSASAALPIMKSKLTPPLVDALFAFEPTVKDHGVVLSAGPHGD
jgi:hypothetical protein